MEYIYKTKGTCSTQIKLNIDGDVVTDVSFTGGCNGNLKAIPALVNGLTVDEIEKNCPELHAGSNRHPAAISLQRHAEKRMNVRKMHNGPVCRQISGWRMWVIFYQ